MVQTGTSKVLLIKWPVRVCIKKKCVVFFISFEISLFQLLILPNMLIQLSINIQNIFFNDHKLIFI